MLASLRGEMVVSGLRRAFWLTCIVSCFAFGLAVVVGHFAWQDAASAEEEAGETPNDLEVPENDEADDELSSCAIGVPSFHIADPLYVRARHARISEYPPPTPPRDLEPRPPCLA
jgi:hypothetical protein